MFSLENGYTNVSSAELCYAVACLTRNPAEFGCDDETAERLAVAFIRELLDRADYYPQRDRATDAIANEIHVYNGGESYGSLAFRSELANEILTAEQEQSRDSVPYLFLRGKVVPGCSKRLTWIA